MIHVMRRQSLAWMALVTFALESLLLAQVKAPASPLDTAMEAFWKAADPREAARATRRIVESGATFDDVLERLQRGRAYSRAKTGRINMRSVDAAVPLDNAVEVPAEYDPAREWPLRVYLHGGVGRPAPSIEDPPARPVTNRIPIAGEIVILPRAWASSTWWNASQADNISNLLDRVKRTYNVDESRVYVTGFSDGGTGVYFLGMRAATPWAACVPLHGQPIVLANSRVGADGQLYAGNLANCPLYIVNGGRDPLYPAAEMVPFVELFRRAGTIVEFRPYPDAQHDLGWWPHERARIETFLAAHPRAAHPERLSWETERTDRYNRFRWVIIERLGRRTSDHALTDLNTIPVAPGVEQPVFERRRPSGRVDATWRGNRIELKTRGVSELTVLVPATDAVDFRQPLVVSVNDRVVHDAIVKPDVSTLLEWGARDNDRTMLYAAALRIVVP
jgi:predicted esterase